MAISFIIAVCILLLLAYVFDVTSSRTRLPSVILLLLTGWIVKLAVIEYEIIIPNLNPLLPVFGTLGLILIVLEGSLELEIRRSKLPLIGKSALLAFIPMLILSFALAYAFQKFEPTTFKTAMVNAIPLAVISSAIAIPSAANLIQKNRQFITYESSLSDIFGVMLFNFVALNESLGIQSVGTFFLEMLFLLVVSFAATMLLSFLLSKINHHVKYVPIILMLFLIYALAKLFHLPALLFILLFGIFLGNLDELRHFKIIDRLKPDILNREVSKLKDLTTEIAFLIRALFFLLFGFLINTSELMNIETFGWAIAVTAGIFLLRFIFLRILKLPIRPLLFIAPRGLITILLFLSIPVSDHITIASRSLVIQVIILTALVMMSGLMTHKKSFQEEGTKH